MILSVADAATQLGISQNAVRNRLKRCSLKGIKRGNRVFVQIDDAPPDEGNKLHRSNEWIRPNEEFSAKDTGQQPANEEDNLANGLAAILEAREELIASLKAQLEEAKEDKQTAVNEKRELLEALKREQTLHQSAQLELAEVRKALPPPETPKAGLLRRIFGGA